MKGTDYTVTADAAGRLILRTPFECASVCQRIPDAKAWSAKDKVWKVSPSRVNLEYLRKELPQLAWSEDAEAVERRILDRSVAQQPQDISDYIFSDNFPPWEHQRTEFARSRGAPAWALHMEQRTGKTRVLIDTSTDLFLRGKIDLVLIIAPNSVKGVWEEQVPEWTPRHVPVQTYVYTSGDKNKARLVERLGAERRGNVLQYLIMNVEAFSYAKALDWVKTLLKGRNVLCAVDESTRIKNHSSSRTKHILKLRPLCAYRRVLTGTPITQSPLDAFAQFAFLDPAILGYQSFYAFRNDYAILGGWNNKQVLDYVNIDKLTNLMAPFRSRVLRDQCFDLPPKSYCPPLMVELAPDQRRIYDQMRDEMLAELFPNAGVTVSATIVLTQMLRLQQIVGGFLPAEKAPPDLIGDDLYRWELAHPQEAVVIPGPNPKLEALLDALEEESGKVIIWSRFRPEIALIAAALRERYGVRAVGEFHGGIANADRDITRRKFEFKTTDTAMRYLVAQQQTGGVGVDFAAANSMYYFSNTFSLEDRLQTEDRAQHGSKRVNVGYTDLFAKDTIDVKKILPSLRGKKSMADQVNGDTVKEWI